MGSVLKAIKSILFIVVSICLFIKCELFIKPKIEVTKNYIINENWNDENNGILIERMKIKKGVQLNIFDESFNKSAPNHWNIVKNLEVDSSFIYSYNTGDSYNPKSSPSKLPNKKLFFSKPNSGYWSFNRFGDTTLEVIGELNNNTWYKFSNLKPKPYYLFVYVDTSGKIHKFSQDLSNY